MKELVTYRLEKNVVLRIIDEAAARGMTRAALIEEWSRKVPALGRAGLLETGSEKKSGGAREVLRDDIPEEVLVRVAKVKVVLPKVIRELPAGVTTASKLEKKSTVMGKSVRTLGDDGKVYINGVAQVSNLREERLARANAGPILRPGQRK
jgi:hypothetical protein